MRRLLFLSLLIAASAAPAWAGQSGKLGAGVILGVPFGASAKYWVDERYAAQAAMGVSDGNFVFSSDYLLHFDDVLPKRRAGRLPLYAGVGIKVKSEKPTFFGLRFIGGVSLFHSEKPLEFFAEVAPVLRLAPSEGAAFDGGVGLRYYFKSIGEK